MSTQMWPIFPCHLPFVHVLVLLPFPCEALGLILVANLTASLSPPLNFHLYTSQPLLSLQPPYPRAQVTLPHSITPSWSPASAASPQHQHHLQPSLPHPSITSSLHCLTQHQHRLQPSLPYPSTSISSNAYLLLSPVLPRCSSSLPMAPHQTLVSSSSNRSFSLLTPRGVSLSSCGC